MKKQFEVNKQLIGYSIVVFIFLIATFLIVQFIDYSRIVPIEIIQHDDPAFVNWSIDNIIIDNNYIAVKGYAFVVGEIPKEFDLNIVFKNTETEEAFEIPTVLVENEELINLVQDDIDYSQSGFLSIINKRMIDFDHNSFEIFIEYNNKGYNLFIDTNQIISVEDNDQ